MEEGKVSTSVSAAVILAESPLDAGRAHSTSVGVGKPARRGQDGATTAAAHRTVKLRPRVYEVPTLGRLCVLVLAENADSIVDLGGIGEDSARQLLKEIMGRGKLTYPLAKVFMEAGDDELSRALASLNLWDAIPAGRHGRHSRHM